MHSTGNSFTFSTKSNFQNLFPSGSFACVCKATYKGKPAAVKVIDLEKTSDDYRLKFLPRELYTIKKLKHRFLIQVIDIYVIGNRVLGLCTLF